MGGGAGGGVAWDSSGGWDFGRRGCGVGFAFAENAFEAGAGEPDEVAAGVHVEGDGLGRVGVESEGESVVATGGEGEGDLVVFAVVVVAVVVVVEADGGAR